MRLNRWTAVVIALLICGSGSLALAQTSTAEGAAQQDQQSRKSESAQGAHEEDRGVLAGPKVDERSAQGEPEMLSADARRPVDAVNVPPQPWMRLLMELELNDEQRRRIRVIQGEYTQAVAAFRRDHGPEIRELEQKFRRMREQGVRPDDETARRARQLRSSAPNVADYQQRLWDLLDENQQATFRELLSEERRKMFERRRATLTDRMDEMNDGRMSSAMDQEAGTRPGDRESAGPPGARGTMLDEAGRRRVRFLQKYQKLRQRGRPPADRERRFDFDEN